MSFVTCVSLIFLFGTYLQTSNAESIIAGPHRAAAVLSEHWYQRGKSRYQNLFYLTVRQMSLISKIHKTFLHVPRTCYGDTKQQWRCFSLPIILPTATPARRALCPMATPTTPTPPAAACSAAVGCTALPLVAARVVSTLAAMVVRVQVWVAVCTAAVVPSVLVVPSLRAAVGPSTAPAAADVRDSSLFREEM